MIPTDPKNTKKDIDNTIRNIKRAALAYINNENIKIKQKAIDKGKKTYVYPWQMRFLVRLVKVIPQSIIDLFIGDSNKYYK